MKIQKEEHKLCLLLNCDYSPLSIITWKKALIWSFRYQENHKYSIDIIDFYKDDYIVGTTKNYPVPAVARTKKFFRINKHHITFSKKNIFIRDDFTCQYCNQKFPINNLTYDHVIPKSKWDAKKGSPTSWTNIVTACEGCNKKKGNKTPTQAGMGLINLPIQPSKQTKYLPVIQFLHKIKQNMPKEWIDYLPDSYRI